MRHRTLWVVMALLLAVASILAPLPDALTDMSIWDYGGALGLQDAEGANNTGATTIGMVGVANDIPPATISTTDVVPIAFSENVSHYIINNWTFIYTFSKSGYTDQILTLEGDVLVDLAAVQMHVVTTRINATGTATCEKISDYEYEVTRVCPISVLTYTATLTLIYNIDLYRCKTTIDFVNGSRNITQTVRLRWRNSVPGAAYSQDTKRVTFTNEDGTWVGVDWSDETTYTAEAAVLDGIADVAFVVGPIAPYAHIVIDPSTVGSSTSSYATYASNQRKVVYAASRFWAVYSDNGDNVLYTSSLDGVTWAADQTLKDSIYSPEGVSIWYDSDNICMVYSEMGVNTPLEYCQFTPCDNGTLSAQTAWQTVIAGDPATAYDRPSVCKDTAGYPYISYLDSTAGKPYVTRANQNNGTWTSCNFTTALSTTTSTSWFTGIVPQLDGKVLAVYTRGGYTIKSKVWNGSAWGSENATTEDSNTQTSWSLVSTSDGVAHLIFQEDDSFLLQYTHYHNGGTAWETEETVLDLGVTDGNPVLSKTLDDNLYCFWLNIIDDHIYYISQVAGVWDDAETDWLTEVDVSGSFNIGCAYAQTTCAYIPVIWLVDDGAPPYNVRFAALDVSVDSDMLAISNSAQRKIFYGASRFWVFYSDGTKLDYRSSLNDGTSWSSDTTVRMCTKGSKVSVWWDGTYVHYAYASGLQNEALVYRRGDPDEDGVITWLAEQNAVTAESSKAYLLPSLSLDTAGHPVLSYSVKAGGSTTPYATKSAQNNGSWSSSTYNTQLSATADATWSTTVLPLADNDCMVIYARDGETIKSKVYDYSASTFLSENATTSAIEVGSYVSGVVTADNVAHIVFLGDADGDINYTHYHSGGVGWETEEAVYDGTSATKAPVLSQTLAGNLYVFWVGDPVADHVYYKVQSAGVWESVPVDWQAELDITANSSISSVYAQTSANYLGVCWLTNDSSPYTLRFAAVERRGLGYSWSQSIPITASAGAGADYQIPVDVYPGTGANSAASGETHAKVYLSDNAQDYPEDIRFTDDDNVTPLDYWSQPILSSGTGSTDNKDTFIYYGDQTANYGGDTLLFLTASTTTNCRRGIINWDISSYSSTDIYSAELKMYYYSNLSTSSAGKSIYVYLVNQDNWTEGTGTNAAHTHDGACWDYYNGSNAWDSGDGGPMGRYIASAQVPASYGWMRWDVTQEIIQALSIGDYQIGFYFRLAPDQSVAGGYHCLFYSKEYTTDTTKRPILAFQYYDEATAPREFWVEVKDDLSDNQSITIWYGKAGDVSGESGAGTFLYYDAGREHNRQFNYTRETQYGGSAGAGGMCIVGGDTIWANNKPSAEKCYIYTASTLDPYTWAYHSEAVDSGYSDGALTSDPVSDNVWIGYIDTSSDVQVAKWDGAAWGDNVTVAVGTYTNPDILWVGQTDVAHPYGHLLCSYRGSSEQIYCKISGDGGATWGAAITIDGDVTADRREHPQLAEAPNGALLCGYEVEEDEEGTSGLYQNRSTDIGNTWNSTEETIHTKETDVDHENGDYVTLDGEIYYVWQCPDPTGQHGSGLAYTHASTYYKKSVDTSGSFSAAAQTLFCGTRDRVSSHGIVPLTDTTCFVRYVTHYSNSAMGYMEIIGVLLDVASPDLYADWTQSSDYCNIYTAYPDWLSFDGDPINSVVGRAWIGDAALQDYAVDIRVKSMHETAPIIKTFVHWDNSAAYYSVIVSASSITIYQETSSVDTESSEQEKLFHDLSVRTYASGGNLEFATAIGNCTSTTLTAKNVWEDTTSPYLDGIAGVEAPYSGYPVHYASIRIRKCATNGVEPVVGLASGLQNYVNISVSPDTWTEFYKEGASSHVHELQMNSWYTSDNDSNLDYYTVTNNGDTPVDVLVFSSDEWLGLGVTWAVSATGDPGPATIGLWAGLEGSGGYSILLKPESYEVSNFLVTNLAASGTQRFGLKVFTPTANGGNAEMSGTVTLTAVVHT